jgi:hypothetical protein
MFVPRHTPFEIISNSGVQHRIRTRKNVSVADQRAQSAIVRPACHEFSRSASSAITTTKAAPPVIPTGAGRLFHYRDSTRLFLWAPWLIAQKPLDKRYTDMVTYAMLARQIIPPRNPPNQANSFAPILLEPLCSLFAQSPFVFNGLQPLLQKHPGWAASLTSPRIPWLPIFCSSVALSLLCFQGLTNCFFRKPFAFKNICVALCFFWESND